MNTNSVFLFCCADYCKECTCNRRESSCDEGAHNNAVNAEELCNCGNTYNTACKGCEKNKGHLLSRFVYSCKNYAAYGF